MLAVNFSEKIFGGKDPKGPGSNNRQNEEEKAFMKDNIEKNYIHIEET